jgi:hypothetical protein
VGHCADHRIYVYGIDYGKQPAAATLYFTDPQDSIGFSAPIITPEGHLLMAGGQHESHFAPYASVVLLHVGSQDSGQPGDSFALAWLWGLMAVVVVSGGVWWWRRKRPDSAPVAAVNTTETTDAIETAAPMETTEEKAAAGDAPDPKAVALMARIEALMDHDRLFLQPELKVADVRQRFTLLQQPPSLDELRDRLAERFDRREQSEAERIARVVALVEHDGCQVQSLVGYFGETRADPCGHCSYCLTGSAQKLPEPAAISSIELDRAVLDELTEAHPAALGTPRQRARFLCGLSSPATTKAKLTRHALFGALAEQRFADVLVLT